MMENIVVLLQKVTILQKRFLREYYNASKIYKEDNNKSYRIDLKSKLYHEGKPVDIYINIEKKVQLN